MMSSYLAKIRPRPFTAETPGRKKPKNQKTHNRSKKPIFCQPARSRNLGERGRLAAVHLALENTNQIQPSFLIITCILLSLTNPFIYFLPHPLFLKMTSQLLHRKTPNGMNMAVRARRSLQACVMGNRFLHSKQPVRCIIKSILLKKDVDEESDSDDSSTFGGSIGSTGSWCWEREKDLWAEDVEEDEKALIMFDNTMLKEGNIDDREVEDIIVSGFNDEDDLQLLHSLQCELGK